MRLPERAFEYIDISIDCLKPSGGYLHFFSHIKSETKQNVISESEELFIYYFQNMIIK